jgi:NSS family neurotransmitter:Na+ symporter
MSQRQLFSTRIGAILSMVGVSVGLGNVWRFPYMMGQHGGSAFLFVYLIFTVLLAIPALMSELALGRETRQGPLGTFTRTLGPFWGRLTGYLLLVTVLVADSYYLVVIGNVAYTTLFSIGRGFGPETTAAYQAGLNNGVVQLFITFVMLIISLYVIHLGLRKGIERSSRYIVPFFLVVIIYLIVNTLMIEGVGAKLSEFLSPNWSEVNMDVVFAGLGQAFFSVGLGGTFLLVYGSYMKNNQDIPTVAISTGIGDMASALFASLFIIPAILVFNLDLTSGPQLIFDTLPQLFTQMPFGRVAGSLFLLALTGIAFLSNLAALEVFANALSEPGYTRLSRKQIILLIGLIEVVLIVPSALNPDLIGVLDMVFGSGMQTLGSAISILALAWFVKKKTALHQIFGAKAKGLTPRIFFFLIKWVIPAILFTILISYIYTNI